MTVDEHGLIIFDCQIFVFGSQKHCLLLNCSMYVDFMFCSGLPPFQCVDYSDSLHELISGHLKGAALHILCHTQGRTQLVPWLTHLLQVDSSTTTLWTGLVPIAGRLISFIINNQGEPWLPITTTVVCFVICL